MRNKLSNVFIGPLMALFVAPACSTATNDAGAPGSSTAGSGVTGSGGAAVGTVGSASGATASTTSGSGVTGMGGTAVGTVGSVSGTTASTTSGSGVTGMGGTATGTVSSVSGTTAGTAMGGGGSTAGGAGGTGGSGGTGGTMSEPVTRPPIEVEGTVPSEYGDPVANPGEWTLHTYPVYYYTTQNSGLSEDDTLERQSTPIMKPCNVYTPPDYDPGVEYPLIFVLHGITDNHNTWMERGNPKPDVLLDNLITSEIIEPVIAVFPQGDAHENWASHDTFGDTVGYFVFGDELMNDLIPYIEANFSVKKDRNFRAFSGFSFGGRQTVNVGLSHHLKDFAWFGAFGLAGGAYGTAQIAQYLEAQDVSTYPLNHFYAMAGNNDSFGANDTVDAYERDLPGAAPAITSENFTAQVVSGAHDYPTVTVGLYNFLRIAFGIVPE